MADNLLYMIRVGEEVLTFPPGYPVHDNYESLKKLLSNYHPITTVDDVLYGDKLRWCLEHCSFKFRDLKSNDDRIWYFEDEKDAAMFALRWGTSI